MSDADKPDKPRSGRVRHDAGGRAIWEWARETGRHALDSTSHLLKKLELTGLTLMGDEAKPWEKGQSPSDTRHGEESRHSHPPAQRERGPSTVDSADPRGKGFNPYDTRTPVGRGAPPVKKPGPPVPRITQPPARKRSFLARLLDRRR